MPTINDLRQQAATIKNATQVGENTANRVGTTFETIADLLESMGGVANLSTIDIGSIDTLNTTGDMLVGTPNIYTLTMTRGSNTFKVGTLFQFANNGRYDVAQVIVSQYIIDSDGRIDTTSADQEVHIFYRLCKTMNGGSLPTPIGTWTTWTELGGSGGSGITIDPYPTQNSGNAVSSGGVFERLQDIAPKVDISAIDDIDEYTDMLATKSPFYVVTKTLSGNVFRIGTLMEFANQGRYILYQILATDYVLNDDGALDTTLSENGGLKLIWRMKQFSGNPPAGVTIGVWSAWSYLSGDSGYQPDNEDIDLNASDQLQFANKSYDASAFSGLGRVYLRKNIATLEGTGKNVLTQAMVNKSNTIYHIQYDYDLGGKAITIPEGCTLQFEGGSLANGTLIGNNTLIVADNYHIFKDIDTKNSIDITDSFYSNSDNKNHNYNGVKTTSKVGDSITMTKGTANTLDSIELDVSCGDVFRITGSGGKEYQGNTWRLFTFVDSDNKITSLSKIGFFGKNLLVAAPTDGKVYLQLNIDGRPDRETRTYDGDYKVEKLKGYFTLQGTFRNREFYPEWFGAAGDGVTDDTEAIQRLLDTTQMLERPTQMTVMLDNYYRITKGLIMYACTTLKGHWVHTQNNPYNAKDDTTITCDFQDTSDWAIQSANLNTPTGALLSLRKVLWRTAVDGGNFCYCDSVRIENVSIIGNSGVPIYGGIRISASNNSSLSDVKVNNFMVGIARGATWYSSDKNVWASNYYISYIADQDMNNFSVYNAYLTTIASSIEITDENVWSTDEVKKRTDVFTNYANGTFINPICENAPNGMTFQNYSTIVIIKPWMEGISKNVFCAYTLCNITIFNPNIVTGDNVNLLQNARKAYTTTFTLIGTNIKGQMDLSENDNVIVYSNGASVPIGTPSGINFYDKSTGRLKHWNGEKWVNEEGYAYQESVKGTYTNRPSVEGMKLGTIYMKEESNGIVRPLFQKTAGVRAKGVFTITAVGLATGDITFTVGNTTATITVPVVAEETIDELRLRIARLLASALGSEKVSIANGIITVYNNGTSTIAENEISFDGGTTGIECTIDKSVLGIPPEFVNAFGGTASSDLIVSDLPATANNGDIVIWASIGKPVYYYNNKWRDFTGNSVEGGIELISGEPIQNINAAAHQIVLTLTSKDAQQQSSQVSVSSDFEGLTSTVELTDASISLYTVTINIPMNVELTGRTIQYTITQAASSAVINGSVTQSGISTDVNSFTELAAGTALYAPVTVIEDVPTRPYINTEVLPNNNYKIEIKAKANALGGRNNYQRLFGSGGWNNGQIMFGLQTSGKPTPSGTEYVKAYYNNVESSADVAADTLEHVYILDGNKFYIDGTLIHTFDEATFSVTDTRYKLRIYGIQIRLNQTYFDGSVFYAKIWDENGTLVRDYVPVKHNVVDLYTWKDKVTNTIYNSPNNLQFELLEDNSQSN